MISIFLPLTPPAALISSAASCAACGIEEPETACASAMTPILMVSSAWPGVARASAKAAALTVKTARLSSILISIPPNDFDGRLDRDDGLAGSLAHRPPPAASEFLSRAPHALGGYQDRRW